jgi:uncharacterized protein YutE (UPF0331/DUF86 family)
VIPALVAAAVLTPDLAASLDGMAGLRNILVHDYVSVDAPRIWQILDQHLSALRAAHQTLGFVPELAGSGG